MKWHHNTNLEVQGGNDPTKTQIEVGQQHAVNPVVPARKTTIADTAGVGRNDSAIVKTHQSPGLPIDALKRANGRKNGAVDPIVDPHLVKIRKGSVERGIGSVAEAQVTHLCCLKQTEDGTNKRRLEVETA